MSDGAAVEPGFGIPCRKCKRDECEGEIFHLFFLTNGVRLVLCDDCISAIVEKWAAKWTLDGST